jgi:hypothetical protein
MLPTLKDRPDRGGNMSRYFYGALFAGLLSLTFMTASSRAADDNKCTIAVKGDNAVVKACKEGGIKKAKAAMKELQKSAKAKGMKAECDDCHKDESAGNWALKPDAEDKFKKMLDLTK